MKERKKALLRANHAVGMERQFGDGETKKWADNAGISTGELHER